VQVPWRLPALRREWNQAKQQVAPWWAENSKEAYSSGLDALARGLANWVASRDGTRAGPRVGFPRFKRKHRGRYACRFTTGPIRVEPDRHHVVLPRLGRIRTHESTRKLARRIEKGTARILAATISRTGGRWFVSFTCQLERAECPPSHPTSVVGVDVGIRHLAVLSTGERIANPAPLGAALGKLRRLNRKLARQLGPRAPDGTPQRPSARWRQTSRRLGRTHARVTNLRRNSLHQLTSDLVGTYATIVVERLNLAGMLHNRRLARRLADAGFGELRRQLAYKTTWAGGRLVAADTFYPSSKTCSGCGHVKAKLLLSERTYRCERCGLVADRDLNAARNLASLVEIVVAGSGPETQNACVRDGKTTGQGGASGNPDPGREAAGSQQPIRA
jgi:IS605 OrfB family transposase